MKAPVGRRRLLLALVVGGAVFGIVTAVQASIRTTPSVINGCYNATQSQRNGGTQLHIILGDASCLRGQTPISWGTGGGLGGTVPSGQTLRGAFDIATTGTVGGTGSTAVSFALPFSQGLAAEWVLPGVASSANCPGPRSAPTAAPGHFCAYLTQLFGTTNNIVDPASAAPASMTTGTVGADLLAHAPAGSDEVIASGVWAATAP